MRTQGIIEPAAVWRVGWREQGEEQGDQLGKILQQSQEVVSVLVKIVRIYLIF